MAKEKEKPESKGGEKGREGKKRQRIEQCTVWVRFNLTFKRKGGKVIHTKKRSHFDFL